MGMDEWGKPTPPCNCLLVTKAMEMQAAIKAFCIDCKVGPGGIIVITECDKCVFFKFS